MTGVVLLAALTLLVLTFGGCGPRRGGPLDRPYFATEPAQDRGRIVFMQDCYKCHPGGEAGVGPALSGKARPARWLRFRVRHAPGAMPSFGPDRLGDKELDDLMAYLAVLRGGSDAEHEPFEAREASR